MTKKRKSTRRHTPKVKRSDCTALIVIDSEKIRKKIMSQCKRAQTTFKKAEREIEQYESDDKPAFNRWYHSVFGPKLSRLKKQAQHLDQLQRKLDRVEMMSEMKPCTLRQAAEMYKHSYQDFEREEQRLLEQMRKQEEAEARRHEAAEKAHRKKILRDFRVLLESRKTFIQQRKKKGYSHAKIFGELARFFLLQTGYDFIFTVMLFQHEEGKELLHEFGLNLGDPQKSSQEYAFEEDTPEPDSFFGAADPADDGAPSHTTSNRQRITELYRQLAFALHPDQAGSKNNPQQMELWHQVQAAVEAQDLDRLEILHAHLEMYSGTLHPQTPVSRIQSLLHMYKESRNALRRRIRLLRKNTDWGFSSKNKSEIEHIKAATQKEIEVEMMMLEDQIEDAEYIWQSCLFGTGYSSETARDIGQDDFLFDLF